MRKTQTNLFKRRVHSGIIVGTFVLATVFAGALTAQTSQSSSSTRDEIEDLMTCYAYGSDALAKAAGTGKGSGAGINIYEECLADDWTMTIVDSDGPIAGPFDRELWAYIVYDLTFVAEGIIDSQHLIGSVQIETDGDRGTMKAYAIVNLVDDTNVTTQIITYTSEVERRPVDPNWFPFGSPSARWVITRTNLEMTAESVSSRSDVGE
jgi:hypothetical protein